MWCGGDDGGPTLAGVPRAEVPFGTPCICGRAEAAEGEVLQGFPYGPRRSADEGTSPDSTHFGGVEMSSDVIAFCSRHMLTTYDPLAEWRFILLR